VQALMLLFPRCCRAVKRSRWLAPCQVEKVVEKLQSIQSEEALLLSPQSMQAGVSAHLSRSGQAAVLSRRYRKNPW
jgi:hypothetical protein